jgi:hypothetical protein
MRYKIVVRSLQPTFRALVLPADGVAKSLSFICIVARMSCL